MQVNSLTLFVKRGEKAQGGGGGGGVAAECWGQNS